MSRTSPLAALALSLLASACGSSSPGVDAGPTADQACTGEAASACAKLDACSADAGVVARYGTLPTCLQRTKTNCLASLAAAATARTPAQVLDCVPARDAESCTAFLDNDPPVACQPVAGTVPLNQPCGFSAQCVSAFCAVDRDAGCGTCASAPALGADCTATGACAPTQLCSNQVDSGVYLCTSPGYASASCDKNTPCGTGFGCVTPKVDGGFGPGLCLALGTTVGTPCDPASRTAAGCELIAGLFCNAASKTCEAVDHGPAGGPCGTLDAGTRRVVCSNGSVCENAVKGEGTCVSRAADGTACDTDLGPSCMPPARCVTVAGTSAGTCVLPASCR